MEISLTTPAILFPAVSLLMLAYTNRFLALANIIRTLHARYNKEGSAAVRRLIEILSKRLGLIRQMQAFGILSLISCMCSLAGLFLGIQVVGQIFFGGSLVLMLLSLIFCLREIYLSGLALEIELEDMQSN